MSDCQHEIIKVNIRVMGWEQYSWTAAEGLAWIDAPMKTEAVPKSGTCMDCGKRVFGDIEQRTR